MKLLMWWPMPWRRHLVACSMTTWASAAFCSSPHSCAHLRELLRSPWLSLFALPFSAYLPKAMRKLQRAVLPTPGTEVRVAKEHYKAHAVDSPYPLSLCSFLPTRVYCRCWQWCDCTAQQNTEPAHAEEVAVHRACHDSHSLTE